MFSLADWTNVAIRVLTEVRNGGGNNADIQEAATQLMDTYPVRAQSCLQYMQQFLSIQEQYLIQQKPLINILAQQQQVFFNNLESLNPVRSAASPRMSMTPGNLRSGSGYATAAAPTAIAPSGRMHPAGNNAPLGVASSSNGAIPAGASNGRGAAGSSSSRKRGLDMDVAVNLGPLYTGDINNGIPSESMITIILAKRVALTENTDDFGLPAYTTNTPNGVSLVRLLFLSCLYQLLI